MEQTATGASFVSESSAQHEPANRPSPHSYFQPDMVVSRDCNGNPLSRYGDPTWDFSSQSVDGTSGAMLHFFDDEVAAERDMASLIREQHKALIWVHIDSGKTRALGTISHARRAAAVWCDKAYARRVSLFELLANPEWVADELGSLSRTYLNTTSTLVKNLWRHRKALNVDFEVPLLRLKATIAAETEGRPETLQTPLIPSRIYCAVLASLIGGLDEIERELEVLLDAYRQSMAASHAAPADGTAIQRKRYRAKVLVTVIEHMKAVGYNPQEGVPLYRFIAGRINQYQSNLMHTVAAFSGMRLGEVSILPLRKVIETFQDRGSDHFVITGYTYKLNGGVKRPCSWITSREGHKAITLAQRIGEAILDAVGGEQRKGQEPLLFPSTGSPFRMKSGQSIYDAQALLIEKVCPVIVQADIDELNQLELARGWQRDGIEVGRRWPVAFHQLRRSLSVYAHRSGMVSLPALKAQLQHITDEMRMYYADGYSRAVNIVLDVDHFSREWNAAKAESSYFGYALGLLFADDELFGRGAERMAQAVSTRSREDTLRLFREGKLAYRETVLGGCVSTEECTATPLQPIMFGCLEKDCVNQVVSAKRLDHVIRTQETVVTSLGRDQSGSVEHRLEAGHLKVLLQARKQLVERVT